MKFSLKKNDNPPEFKIVVKIITSYWHNNLGVNSTKSIRFLKRKGIGYSLIQEECSNIGAEEVIEKLTNLKDVTDGIYEVVTIDLKYDWETGDVDDWNYKLIPYNDNLPFDKCASHNVIKYNGYCDLCAEDNFKDNQV